MPGEVLTDVKRRLGIFETLIGRAFGQAGSLVGISAGFLMYLHSGYTVAVLSNHGGGAPG